MVKLLEETMDILDSTIRYGYRYYCEEFDAVITLSAAVAPKEFAPRTFRNGLFVFCESNYGFPVQILRLSKDERIIQTHGTYSAGNVEKMEADVHRTRRLLEIIEDVVADFADRVER